MKKLVALLFAVLFLNPVSAESLFDADNPIRDGLNVFEVSAVFSDVYENLESVKWSGKDVGIAIEGLEKIHPDIHIAATDERIILVWHDSIIGNWSRPVNAKEFGEVTTAIVLSLRRVVPSFRSMSESQMYSAVISGLLSGIDEYGKYIHSTRAQMSEDVRILTSVGIEGIRDERGNFRIKGVYRDSPADGQGIKAGNIITEINGREIGQMTDGDIASALSGFNSGTLKLTVFDESGPRRVVLRRATVVLADADIIVKDPILEIVVHNISDRAVSIVAEALNKYANASAGIVLDLRSAGGVDERAVAKIAGLFMGKIRVLRIRDAAGDEIEVIPGGDSVTDLPTIVLVSGGTHGTAEALAAAFYENKRGILVGTPTAGVAKLATLLPLRNGGQLQVLNRAIRTGDGTELSGRGIFPIVCLSNIRSDQQRQAFFVNILNGNFNAKDFNKDANINVADTRAACPQVTSGDAEDAVSAAVSAQILTDLRAYKELVGK